MKKFIPTDYGYLRVEEEVKKIKEGYIPRFYTYGNSRELYSDNKVICENYFAESIVDTLKKKVKLFNYEQMEYQMHIIDLSILTMYGKEDFGNTHVLAEVKDDFLDKENIKKMVEPLIRRIISYIYFYDENIGTVFLPHLSESEKMWVLKDMDVNLYENGGIILLLAAYGDTYNDLETLQYAASLLNFLNYRGEDESIKNLSIFSGEGCLIYLNYCLYRFLERNDFMKQEAYKYRKIYSEMESKILNHLLDEKLCKEDFDFMNGIISTISFVFTLEAR